MKRMIIMVGIIILAGVMPTPGNSEIIPGQISVSPFIGWYSFDKDMKLYDKPVYGLRLGYDITQRWGVEGVFDYVDTKVKNAEFSADVNSIRLDALYHFRYKEKLVPFLAAGLGGTRIAYPITIKGNDPNDFLFNYGAGVKYFLSDNWALRGDIRNLLVFDGGRSDWEYTLGITFLFGGKKSKPAAAPAPAAAAVAVIDSDGDGVPDSVDKCPNTPKSAKVDKDGCPMITDGDSDGDGVPNSLDKCPDTPKGVKVDKNGCPLDSDNDGVPDYLDKCPDTPTGVKVDKNGCPLDSDNDGVPDYLDKCADTPKGAKIDKDGCPVKLAEKVSIALQIQFDSGKTDIKPQYNEQIKKVADFMVAYPDTSAVIEGHTDNVGKEASNLRLSTKRAESVRTYLINKFGVAPGRLTAKGFGSSKPVADNKTPEGRQKNRRIDAVFETTTVR
jgi:OmpA-OmpF porin, OOP family